MTVDEAVKKYNRLAGGGALRRMAQNSLQRGEEALYAYVGLCVKNGEENECIMVATQRRVLCCSRKLITKEMSEIPLKNILGMQIQAGKGMFLKELHIQSFSTEIVILDILSELTKIQEIIQYLINSYDELNEEPMDDVDDTEEETYPTIEANISTELSAPDEIIKWKAALDAGAITQEEYEAKKKQLLNL